MTAPLQTELAAALGVDPALVTRYKARGMPTDSIDAALAWKTANVRARVGGKARQGQLPLAGEAPDAAAAPEGYADHRARREKAEADSAEVRALREQGKVVMAEGAERATFDAFRALRDAAFQALRDGAPKVRGITEAREIQTILESELRLAWAGVEERLQRRLVELRNEARP